MYLRVLNGDGVGFETGCLDADEQGGAPPGGDELSGEHPGLEAAGVGALELLHGLLDDGPEAGVGVLGVEVPGELHHGLRVGLGREDVALGLEEGLDVLVVGDDAVVDDDEAVVGVRALGVGVLGAGDAVGGPAGVGDADVHLVDALQVQLGGLFLDLFLQVLDLALALDQVNLVVGVAAVDSDA